MILDLPIWPRRDPEPAPEDCIDCGDPLDPEEISRGESVCFCCDDGTETDKDS